MAKYSQVTPSRSEAPAPSREHAMKCFLPPHRPITFQTYEEYEQHYNRSHTHRCTECLKNLPSERYLELHIAENHNPINQALKVRGESIYACFVEDCDKVVNEWWKRRLHCIDKHQYPRNYDFFIVNDGIDGRRSMLQPEWVTKRKLEKQQTKASSKDGSTTKNKPDVTTSSRRDASKAHPSRDSRTPIQKVVVDTDSEHEDDPSDGDSDDDEDEDDSNDDNDNPKDDDMKDLTKSMSSLKFVPRNIRFGRGGGRGGFSRQ